KLAEFYPSCLLGANSENAYSPAADISQHAVVPVHGASGCSAEIPPSPPLQKGGGIFLPWLIAFVQCEGSGLSLLAPSPNWARVYTTRTSPYGVSLPPFLKGDGGGFPAGNSE